MEKYFINVWEENKQKLEDYFRTNIQEEYSDYKNIFQKILELVVDGYKDNNFKCELDNIKVIDYGDYQGTLIFIFCEDSYQPNTDETYYTSVYYGSCSGCDTLQGIADYNYDETPNEEQIKDYMSLALHMVQHIKCFGESELNEEDN